MEVFKEYALFYDLLYQEKDYEVECDFLEEIFSRYSRKRVNSILDLGCGTGGHAIPLAKRGYIVTGVDQSIEMIKQGREKAPMGKLPVNFAEGDIRGIDLGKKFDAVIAMFAVMGYQISNSDLEASLRVIRHHLSEDGIFICDCWSGSGVLRHLPSEKIKEIDLGREKIIRLAQPMLDIISQTVEVNYILKKVAEEKIIDRIKEAHRMRYFFPQEIAYFMKQVGLEVVRICPFMCIDRDLSFNDWNMTVIATNSGNKAKIS